METQQQQTIKKHPTLNLYITDEGIVYQNNTVLIPFICRGGLYVSFLTENPKYPDKSKKKEIIKTRSIRVLVWETYKNKLPNNGLWINHKDSDPANCSPDNLIADLYKPKWLPRELHSYAIQKYKSYLPPEQPQKTTTFILRKKAA